MLNKMQTSAAKKLRQERPPVHEGTNVVISIVLRARWYARVTRTMHECLIMEDQVKEFCDLAGVPD